MAADQHPHEILRAIAFASLTCAGLLAASPAAAEIKTITATGEYRMGDNDTRTDAKRLALLDAKRLALEQAGTYLESVTEIKNLGVARDELNAYTAGIVEVSELSTKDAMEGATHIIRVQVTAKIDMGVVALQIDALRKNERGKAELLWLSAERNRLRQELEARTRELATVKSKDKVDAVAMQRKEVLTKLDAFDLLAEALVLMRPLFQNPLKAMGPSMGEYRKETASLVQKAIEADPSSPTGHSMMGFLLELDGNLQAAITEDRIAVSIRPDNAFYHWQLGHALRAAGNLTAALDEYLVAQRLKPGVAMFHSSVGDVLVAMSRQDGAIPEYLTALELEPDSADSHYGLGVALMRKDPDRAISEFQKTLTLEPNYADAHFVMGALLEDKGLKQLAADEFRAYLRLVPDIPQTRKKIELARSMLLILEK